MYYYSKLQVILHWIVLVCALIQCVWFGPMAGALAQHAQGAGGGDRGVTLWVTLSGIVALVSAFALLQSEPRRSARDLTITCVVRLFFYMIIMILPLIELLAWNTMFSGMVTLYMVITRVLIVVFVVHVLAMFWRQFVRKDYVMSRTLWWRR